LAADLTGFIRLRLPAPAADFVPPIVAFFCGFRAPDHAELLFPGWISPAADARLLSPRETRNRKFKPEVLTMLSWVVTFLIVALIAGILGFGGIAGVSIEIAKTIFFIAVVLFLVSAVVGLARGRTRV
jgi:uncharacterized membrane protein YtjA (UPF0391 family)